MAATDITGVLSKKDFDRVRRVAAQQMGLDITEDKHTLVARRIHRLAQEQGYASAADFCARGLDRLDRQGLAALANHLSTNHTYFWREHKHFELLQGDVLPQVIQSAKRSRDLRVWCAAASTGEEPYTLAMLQQEVLGAAYGSWKGGVLATDISERVLKIAREGVYEEADVRRLPSHLGQRYFVKEAPGLVRVAPTLRRELTYRRLNLNSTSWGFRAPFQIIFCRNVMIYFDAEQRRRVTERMMRWLEPGGWLFIGAAESLPQIPGIKRYAPAVYRRV